MIRAIIIDDEAKARKNLQNLLAGYCTGIEILDQAADVDEGVEMIRKHHPDLIFLDVKMQKETGFDLLGKIGEITFEIIFVTAHDNYAIRAFKFSAVDYLMKPLSIKELQTAVERAREKIQSKQSKAGYEVLRQNLSGKSRRIAISTMEGTSFVPVADIIRCEADGSYTHVFIRDGKQITVSRILKEFDELLAGYGFSRVHQSHLINMERISRYLPARGGSVEMDDGSILPVGRTYREGFLERMKRI